MGNSRVESTGANYISFRSEVKWRFPPTHAREPRNRRIHSARFVV
jgi:hypothetical protein